MFTKNEIEEIVKKKIESDEKLGEQTGGSGHLGYVSYELKDVQTKELSDNHLQIDYKYCTYVETEFTYEPDNPPYEYTHRKSLIVNGDKAIIEEKEIFEETENISSTYSEEDWENAKKEIMEYVEIFLAKIEWEFGENRAPIKYPPDFYELFSEEHGLDYCCMIEEDFGEDAKMYFKSENPHDLLDQIKEEFTRRFSSDVE